MVLMASGLSACSVDPEGDAGVQSITLSGGDLSQGAGDASATTAGDTTGAVTATGDGDGDGTTTGDGDGTATGDGDGTTTGDGDGTATGDGDGTCGGAPLSADLEVPAGCGTTCSAYGFSSDCGSLEICRLKDTTTGVCESCSPCGNLNASCTASSECDILFTCYLNRCTAMCDFTTPQTCGNPSWCLDVGHPTHGVCDPFGT
jgi:hypothetical protein